MKLHESSSGIIMLGLFVDDVVAMYNRSMTPLSLDIKAEMKKRYEISELGQVRKILGMKVTFDERKLFIDQSTYIDEKLKLYNLSECKPVSTPEGSSKFHAMTDVLPDGSLYRGIVGSLLYAAVSSRPDIVHAVKHVE